MSGDIIYREVNKGDEAELREMYNYFISAEPLALTIGLKVPEEARGFIEIAVKLGLDSGLSYVAVDRTTGKIIGIRVCLLHTKENPVRFDYLPEDRNRNLMVYTEVCGRVYGDLDVFDHLKSDAIVSFKGLFVREEYRNHGIAGKLHRMATDACVEKGYRAFIGETTNIYSRAVYDRQGFEVLNSIDYDDLLIDGEKVMKVKDDRNTSITCHAKKI